ncbi:MULTISPECIES: hypothetical protein [Streptomyces]|uniref:hypothetical protein n=1 Tax=Streptomyces TaxID=1883 RepID=UPI0036AFD251
MDSGGRVLVVHDAVSGQQAEGLVGGRDRVPVGIGEADWDAGDGAAVCANVGDGPFHTAEQGVSGLAFGHEGQDRGLVVQDEKSGAGGVECGGGAHTSVLLAGGVPVDADAHR